MRIRGLLVGAGFVLSSACGSETTASPEAQHDALAWVPRDDGPPPHTGHTAVLDEANDRMVVFGGGDINLTWALYLSGPKEGTWEELVAEPPFPPEHGLDTYATDSAVYDPIAQRMIVVLNSAVFDNELAAPPLWQLSLGDTPVWSPLPRGDEPPDLGKERLAIDVSNRRLFVVGSGTYNWSVWSLSLDGTPSWTHWADHPNGPTSFQPSGEGGRSVVYDAAGEQLIVADGMDYFSAQQEWSLSLGTSSWTLLGTAPFAWGAPLTLDAAHARLVMTPGPQDDVAVSGLSPWGTLGHQADANFEGASAVLDAKRGRILYFGGGVTMHSRALTAPDNSVSSLDLDTLTWSLLVPATQFGTPPS